MSEREQEDKKTASKPGDKLETPVLDRGGSKRALNSLNNGDNPEWQSLIEETAREHRTA